MKKFKRNKKESNDTIKGKRRKVPAKVKFIIVLLLIAAFVVTPIFAHPRKSIYDDYEDGMGMQQMTATAEVMTIENSISSDGEVKSALEEDKVPHATYKLKDINVEKNQQIREGDTILTYTNGAKMLAPYNCVILDWTLPNPGSKLTNDHSVKLAGTDILKMELEVEEDKVLQVDKGDKATVKVDAVDGKYKGEVSFVSDVGEYGGGASTFSVSIIFENDGNVKLGMNGSAKITLDKAEDVLAVPVDAVYEEDGHSYVSLLTGDAAEAAMEGGSQASPDETGSSDEAAGGAVDMSSAEEVEVKTGLKGDEFIEIKSGLKEGDVVVYEPLEDDEWDEEMY
ncbi:MAG: HlyD family efflux transporter periplasmic adaptor subunit [Firmicutes bacterium]|nr:HlyD family efflux transporter periplasmic adaptor subunit [Bacillota bacterium]